MARTGRPSRYAEQVAKLERLGATDGEIEQFFGLLPSESDWLFACLMLIRQDRRGVFAVQKKKRSQERKVRRRTDPSVRLVEAMRARLWAALKGRSDGALFSRLGYTRDELVAHLESKFDPGMSWANYGSWHVDHILPCASFDQTDDLQFRVCWALNNLQPLWASDNVKKGAKIGSP